MADASPARHIPSMTESRKGVSLSTSAPQVRPGREMTQREVGIPDEVDRGSPLFFLSYAHSQTKRDSGVSYERNRWFVKFFEDLSENVAELVSRPAGSDPGYMDQWIAAGRLWTPDLLNAIGTCQVFVALLSPIYIDRDWCGMEWPGDQLPGKQGNYRDRHHSRYLGARPRTGPSAYSPEGPTISSA
jgi:hypothetical protein